MQVKLLDPLDAHVSLRRTYVAIRTCQSRKTPYQLWLDSADLPVEKMLPLVQDCYRSNHFSVFRHVEFMFSVSGISRACSHQLVRHHVGFSPEQTSQRAVDAKYFDFVMPPSIEAIPELEEKFAAIVDQSKNDVADFTRRGVPKEDSRFLLPAAVSTNLVITANLNSLILVARERLCSLAQWEVRYVVASMRAQLGRSHPWTREMLTISCIAQGYCSQVMNRDNHCHVRVYSTPNEVAALVKDKCRAVEKPSTA